MRVLFVYSTRDCVSLRHPLPSLQDIHIGLSYISAFLKSKGHSTRLVVLDSEAPKPRFDAVEQIVTEFKPQLACFTAVSTHYPFVTAVAQRFRQLWPDLFLLLGGAHASLQAEAVVRDLWDAVCVGEGEHATAELIAQLETGRTPQGIPNLWFKHAGGTVEKNACREFFQSLDELPFPDREMWHPWVQPDGFSIHMIQPSRGCPYRCAYCSNHALRKLAGGKYVRLRSPEAIIRELVELRQRYPAVNNVYLQSETIAVNVKWLTELSHRIKTFNDSLASPPDYTCNFRVAPPLVTDEVFDALARANVRTIEIGLESGSERIRREVLRRDYSNENFYQSVALARQRGMRVNVYNLIGIPGETPADHAETIAVNHRVCPEHSITSIFFPYPGTDLHRQCEQQGWIQGGAGLTAERKVATLDLPTFRRRKIQRAYDWFEFNVYRGRRPLHYRVRRVIRNKIEGHPWMFYLFLRMLPLWHALRRRGS
jgi:anaerobic magnesium-protoporphyrin IX monomethyl ester cyclase